ncbi:MAG: hypothetical protein MUF87_10645 [Anaerolineae bacterium]|nr:hypothetical protein [Anaerolineae bacterium]
MTIKLTWHDPEETILTALYDHVWNWDEFNQAMKQGSDMINAKPHWVDVVVILKTPLPSGNPIPHFRKTIQIRPKNQGKMVMVSRSSILIGFIRHSAQIVEKVIGRPEDAPIFASTVEEALEIVYAEQKKRVSSNPTKTAI